MRFQQKLPSYLIGEIICRLPTKSLARFRVVSKTWNAFWEDKSFSKKYLARTQPQFIVWTNSQICSVGINDDDGDDPKLEVRDISSYIPIHSSLGHCDGVLLSGIRKKGFEVWNPCLRRKRLVMVENHDFRFCGIGYDNSRPETSYKVFGYDFYFDTSGQLYQNVAIYNCKSDTCKFIGNAPCEQDLGVPQLDSIVSMNGNLYWIAYHSVARQYFIRSFDFSKEMFKTFCLLPHNEQDFGYTQVLAVFKGDRFSLLRQSFFTRKIEVLVTKHKIDGNREAVAWICFMTVSIPNFPRFQHKCLDSQPSYFIDSKKRLFVCTCDETGHACIYVVKGDFSRKIPIDSIVGLWPSHRTYIPSFISVQRSEKLPSELVGEILCRLPRKSLAQSRTVSKSWNAFWEDKSFLRNYLGRVQPQFILRTNSHICSVDIINLDDDDPIIEVRDITLDMPCPILTCLVHCDGFLLSSIWKKGFVVWNPCLRQKRLIENHEFRFCGLGYDNSRPRLGYKILGVDLCVDASGKLYPKVAIYEFESDSWKFSINNASCEQDWGVPQLDTIVSLTGNLYWIAYSSATRQYFIRSFDFSLEMFKTFCLLPHNNEQDFGYSQVLAVFRGDRFSLLRQSYMTRKIEIFVTKHKIDDGNGEAQAVVWMCFMTVSIPDIPRLRDKCLDSQPSYFVDSKKRLFVCTCDETGHACIYIVKEDLFRKIPIDSMVDLIRPSHLTYIPSFIPIPFQQA